jgi:carbonic anhydrase/acetyltransferase-like protein (isoleucine patch superfamily)
MPLLPYQDKLPVIGKNCFIAPTAVLIGDVTLHDGASVWFGCVLRGDVAPIG